MFAVDEFSIECPVRLSTMFTPVMFRHAFEPLAAAAIVAAVKSCVSE